MSQESPYRRPVRPPRFGCLSCFMICIGGFFLVTLLTCGGGYWALFNSSWPLKKIEEVIESTGDVEINGLTGTMNSGFHIDTLRFKSGDDDWSELKDIDFEFNGARDAMFNNRFLIDNFSVAEGTIYFDSPSPDHSLTGTGPLFGLPGADGMTEEQKAQFEDAEPMELRLDRLSIRNLTLVDTVSQVSFDVSEFRMTGLHVDFAGNTTLNKMTLESEDVEFKKLPTEEFADQASKNSTWRIQATLKASASERLLRDVTYEEDRLLTAMDGSPSVVRVLDGQIEKDQQPGELVTRYSGFSPGDFISDIPILLPSKISGQITTTRLERSSTDGECRIEPGMTFFLGLTQFNVTTESLEIAWGETTDQVLQAEAVGDFKCGCRLIVFAEDPWIAIQLESDEVDDPAALLSRIAFGRGPVELTEGEQRQILATLEYSQTALEEVSPATRRMLTGETEDTDGPESGKADPDSVEKTDDDSNRDGGPDSPDELKPDAETDEPQGDQSPPETGNEPPATSESDAKSNPETD